MCNFLWIHVLNDFITALSRYLQQGTNFPKKRRVFGYALNIAKLKVLIFEIEYFYRPTHKFNIHTSCMINYNLKTCNVVWRYRQRLYFSPAFAHDFTPIKLLFFVLVKNSSSFEVNFLSSKKCCWSRKK